MPDDDLLREPLRDQWHLVPQKIEALPRPLLSRRWEVTSGSRAYVVSLAAGTPRAPVEAGLAAAEHLRRHDFAVGEPVRTLSGALTAPTPAGPLAVLKRPPGRPLDGADPLDQQWWGDRLGVAHRTLQVFHHPDLRPWQPLDLDAPHLAAEPWLRPALAAALTATVRLTVTDRLTYGVLHGDPAPAAFVLDTGTGRAGMLDCGTGGTGPLAYDVAAAVLYAGGPARAGELIDGYLAAGPVGADELFAALPVLLRLRWAVRAAVAARDGRADDLLAAREALEATP